MKRLETNKSPLGELDSLFALTQCATFPEATYKMRLAEDLERRIVHIRTSRHSLLFFFFFFKPLEVSKLGNDGGMLCKV